MLYHDGILGRLGELDLDSCTAAERSEAQDYLLFLLAETEDPDARRGYEPF
jgi:hypothetical protein